MAPKSELEPRAPTGYRPRMISSLRMLAGTLMLLAFVIIYVLAAMLVATAMLPNAGFVTQFIYYAVAGLAWVPVAGLIVSWMHRVPHPHGTDGNR